MSNAPATPSARAPKKGPLHTRFAAWKEKGPLYTYRRQSSLTMGAVASTLNVSIGTVQNLEDGNRDPRNKPYWPALCRLLIKQAQPKGSLAAQWGAWLDRKPRA